MMKTYSPNKGTTMMKIFLKKSVVIAFAFVMANLFFTQQSFGQAASATWPLTANANPTLPLTGNITAAAQTGGSGIGAMSYAGTGVSSNGWSSGAQDANDYYQFTISPTSGNNLTVTSITMLNSTTLAANGTALIQYSLSSSFTSPTSIGSSFSLTTSEVSHGSSSLSISVLDGQTLYVRVFAWSNFTTVRAHNVVISGTTASSCITPIAYSVTGGGDYCSGGSGVAIGLSNSQTNVTYQLFNGASPVGSTVPGNTGSTISFGNQTSAGTYTVVATNTVGGCTNNMTGSTVVTVNAIPTASVSVGNKQDLTCFLSANGSITVTGSGGLSSYLYSIDNGGHYYNSNGPIYISGATYQATGIFNGLPAGAYKIRVKDGNGCESKSVQ